MPKRGSIQLRLFAAFFLVVLTLIALFALISYSYVSRTLTQSATDFMLAQAGSIAYQTDTLLQDANELSGKLLFSQELLDLFYSDMFAATPGSIEKRHRFDTLVYSIGGPQFPPFQINMFRFSGEFAGVGTTGVITRLPPETIAGVAWLPACVQEDGAKLITPPQRDAFGFQRGPVVSLCRTFGPRWGGTKDSAIEIQVPFGQIEDIVKRQLAGVDNLNVVIFDSAGTLVYPQERAAGEAVNWTAVRAGSPDNILTQTVDGKEQVLALKRSQHTGWTVALVQDYSSLLAPADRVRNNFLLVALGGLLLTVPITYTIARSLTLPIQKIHESVAQLTLETLPGEDAFKLDTTVNELEELNAAFQTMCVRLREALDETVAARALAIQSRMLALQAQMDPHFLYNMIATISILAEKGESTQIVAICESLGDMMGYISTGGEQFVPAGAELQHTQAYMDLMCVRFTDELNFTCAVPPSLLDVCIPKLTVQPLVENGVKHATRGAPPWHIGVAGEVAGGRWQITVSDNGVGFSPPALAELCRKLPRAAESPSTLELNGMGLINIYMRLNLHYGAQAVFEFGNRPEGGAYVRVGGPLEGT
jgi:two-component system, sensor histidine kinase YesM